MKHITKEKILIIDDDEGVVKTISAILERMEIAVDFSFTLDEGFNRIDQSDFDVVLLDVNLPDGNGIDHIPHIIDREFPPLIIIMTAYSDPDGAELAIENGAWDYLQKPISSKDLRLQVSRAFQFQKQKKQTIKINTFEAPDIIGRSKAIQKSLIQASQIVNSDANVLITGDTGTGKELFAKAIHANSARRNGDFIVVDCSVLTENLIESVLFGHEKGSFTGADRQRKGLVALANGGTLFLDEVGELPVSIQSTFLRVLQEKTFRPVGSEKEMYSNFRVVCATNKNLDEMASKNYFRTDLLYRLKTFVLKLPALRNRGDDITLISKELVSKCCVAHDMLEKEISQDFLEVLQNYEWPGNVRELVNIIETSVASSHFENKLFAFHLPPKIRAQIVRSKIRKIHTKAKEVKHEEQVLEPLNHSDFIKKTEKKYFESLYTFFAGDIKQLIKKTGLSRSVLYRKLKQYKIH